MSLSVIIPTFNEAENITLLIDCIYKHINELEDEVIVIDDNSPDNTAQIVSELKVNYSSLSIYCRKDQNGLTSAIQTGIQLAKKDYIIWLDADFSHNPRYISSLINEMLNCDVCLCSRFLANSKDERKLNIQKILSCVLSKFCKLIFSNKISDWTSGFICLKREVFSNLSLKGYYGDYFIYLMVDLIQRNYLIKEIPYHTSDRMFGASKTSKNFKSLLFNGFFYLKAVTVLSFQR